MRQSFLWRNREPSSHVVDRRPMGNGPKYTGFGSLILILLYLLGFGVPNPGVPNRPAAIPQAEVQEMDRFAAVILRDTEDVWTDLFRQMGKKYVKPEMVLFTDSVESGCGRQYSSLGPFYCPRDRRLYIDLQFFREVRDEFGVDGEFARAYVIAHEVGHHVQNLLGIKDPHGTVRVELQADFLAGVWAHHAQKRWGFLQKGDVEESLRLASSIGDDSLQKKSGGEVRPDLFTHGTAEQRVRWFTAGLKSGKLSDGKISLIK